MREQKRLSRETIINNMVTIDKSTAQGLQARSGTCLYFAVCEQWDKHCVSKGFLNEEKWEACQKVSCSESMTEQPPTCAQIHTSLHIWFFKVFFFFQACTWPTIPQNIQAYLYLVQILHIIKGNLAISFCPTEVSRKGNIKMGGLMPWTKKK